MSMRLSTARPFGGEDLGLTPEPRDTFRVAAESRGEDLQCDLATPASYRAR
jgi:hypothetical protein